METTTDKIILTDQEPNLGAGSEELANVIINRIGVMPRKKGSTDKMPRVFLELYERSKAANRDKNPKLAVMTVEEMSMHAGITRQTMYDYLKRWLAIDLITKTSYIDEKNKAVIGYKLNGPTLEGAFEKSKVRINNNLNLTSQYIAELQKRIKNEKISLKQQREPVLKNAPEAISGPENAPEHIASETAESNSESKIEG